MLKMHFLHGVKYSKSSGHVTDDVTPSFDHLKISHVKNYLPTKLRCRVIKRRDSTALGLAF